MGDRKTRHDYAEPGSFTRVEEAALAYADADSEDDASFWRARTRLRVSVLAFRMPGRQRKREIEALEAQLALPMRGGQAPRLVCLDRAAGNVTREACSHRAVKEQA
jgi:hypothetical protein